MEDSQIINSLGQLDYFIERVDPVDDISIWKRDKDILKNLRPAENPGVKLSNLLPSNEDAARIIRKRQEKLRKPQSLEVNPKTIEEIVRESLSSVERLTGSSFMEFPNLEVLGVPEYIRKFADIQQESVKRAGWGEVLPYPSQLGAFPGHGLLMVPSRYVAIQPSQPSGYRVMEFDWDSGNLRYDMFNALLHFNLRQLRGEWKEDYFHAISAMNPEFCKSSDIIRKAVSQIGLEKAALSSQPEWSLHVLSNKIQSFWGDRFARGFYAAAASLKGRSLSQLASIDFLYLLKDENRLFVGFDLLHPSYAIKKMIYTGQNTRQA